MNPDLTNVLAGRLMKHPAIAYHEHAVRDEIEGILRQHDIPFIRDRFGNVIAKLATSPERRPVVLAAHMDHPGFEVIRTLDSNRWLARFRGGVPKEYFRPGIPVRLMPGSWPAKLAMPDEGKPLEFELHSTGPAPKPPAFAVWELEDYALEDGNIVGRACDDLVGVACALSVLIQLRSSRAKVHVIGAFTRAEEVGFHGALAIAATEGLPRNSLVISLETSRQLPGVSMGQGVIIRTGDKASVFNSEATRFISEVAGNLRIRDQTFQFQRALMSGGTCEATAYQEYGYQSAAVCVALGNYHNCGEHDQIRAEYVSQADASSMTDLLRSVVRETPRYGALTSKLGARLKRLAAEAQKCLPRSNTGRSASL